MWRGRLKAVHGVLRARDRVRVEQMENGQPFILENPSVSEAWKEVAELKRFLKKVSAY